MKGGPAAAAAEHVLVLADGDAPARAQLEAAWPGWDGGAGYVVAADGGARLAASLGLTIDEWVGDGDSLGADGLAELRAAGVRTVLAPMDKEESDTELGVAAAARVPGVRQVTILGAFGGARIDHEIANLYLLAHPALEALSACLLGPAARIRVLRAPGRDGAPVELDLRGRVGDVVSLIPIDAAAGVTTRGLRYPLADEDLEVGPARGLSNVRDSSTASVRVRNGRLLVIEVPATLPE